MNRLLLLLPVLALVGCDPGVSATPPGQPAATVPVRTERTAAATATGTRPADVRAQDPTERADPPFRAPEIEEKKDEPPPEKAPPIPDSYKALNKGKTIYFEKAADGTRRVHLMTEVVLREGPLEVLVCKLNTKEHESILHVDVDAREIHFALLAAGATPGHPVQFVNPKTMELEFKPPTGTKVKVSLTYRENGKVKTVPAAEWVKDRKSGKQLGYDWVFAGSRFFKDPDRPDAPDYYMANNGEIVSLSNFPDSMLDLPIKSSKDVADLQFEADTPKIPPTRTPVLVTLEPVVEKKK